MGVGELQIVSDRQNQGIGTSIVKNLMVEAKLKRKKLWLRVIQGNPAERLYKKLGFTIFEESATHKKMEIQFCN